jgi:phosphoglycerate kinase
MSTTDKTAYFGKQTIKDYDVRDQRVLLRADYNVPLDADGEILDDYRLQQSLPTLEYLLSQNCRIVICSHLGRPTGKGDASASLRPVAKRLSDLLGRQVIFLDDCMGPQTKSAIKSLAPGKIALLENLRYYHEEEINDHSFAQKLAQYGDVFVQDGFGVVHRAHASTDAITKYVPSIAGLLVLGEVTAINKVMQHPKKPLMAIIGGAKIRDKLSILHRFIDHANIVVVGGAMANTFLLAKGLTIGRSKADVADIELAEEIIKKASEKAQREPFIFYIPQDGVVAKDFSNKSKTRIVDWSAHVIADIQRYPQRPRTIDFEIGSSEMILDIGPVSASFIAGAMQLVRTVVWNGAMGVTEISNLHGPIGPFAHGTETIVEAMIGQYGNRPYTLVGGGDTVGYIEQRKLVDSFHHVSTGGGASMDLMSGSKLPGVEALLDREEN